MRLHLDLQLGDERVFTDEAFEQIERIEHGLLALEAGEPDPQVVNEVFRAAHTLKGSAATIGHRRMAELTHAMENVFGALRDGEVRDARAFVEILLATIDVLRVLTEEVAAGETRTDAPEALTEQLRERLAAALGAPGSPPQASTAAAGAASDGAAYRDPLASRALAEAPQDGRPRTLITCRVEPASEWKAVRLLQAAIEAEESGRLVASAPTRAEIENGHGGETVVLLVDGHPEEAETLRLGLAAIDEVIIADVAPASREVERRQVDLGPEARGTTPQERLAVAGDRLKAAQQTIRIDVARLEELMNLAGELVVHKTRVQRQAQQLMARLGDDSLSREAEEGAQQLARIAAQIQDQVTRLRMLPIDSVFNRFPRVVRDLASRFGKEVDLVIEGKETELDRSVLDEVGDPLGHLVRNALDHGIETVEQRLAAGKPARGRLRLAARHGDGQVIITVEDDGRGLDPTLMRRAAVTRGLLSDEAAAALSDAEALQLIFAPGLSTAERVTDVSGRGVGMDVVRTNIERLGGRVEVSSAIGQGTRLALRLPLTLAIVSALLVRSAQRICALPLSGVAETLRLPPSALQLLHGRPAVHLRGRVLPVEVLDVALGDRPRPIEGGERGYTYLVVVRSGDRELALAVDELIGEQEIVLKSLGAFLGSLRGIAGATILADGGVALVVDIAALLERSAGTGGVAQLRRVA